MSRQHPPADPPRGPEKQSLLLRAAHDVRQPFQAMRLFLHLLEAQLDKPGQLELARRLEAALDSGEGMLTTLLEATALEEGRVQPAPGPLELGPVMARAIDSVAEEAAAKGLSLRCVPSRAVVRSDPALLERMLRHLVTNAVRHAAGGRILVGVRRRAGALELMVCDEGGGIPGGRRDELFQGFTRLGGADKRQGLGLGLRIVRQTAGLLGHGVELRDGIGGRGCCAVLRLERDRPADVPAVPRPDAATPEPTPLPPGGPSPLILVVEDDRLQLAGLEAVMSEWGVRTLCAHSREAMRAALGRGGDPPDLVVSDFRLPGGATGPDVLRDVRRLVGRDVPGILLTGDSHPDTRALAEAEGMELLPKPIHPGRLRRAIEAALGRPLDDA